MLKKIILKGEQKKVLFLPSTNPIQIKGVAGSGKTTVALYRAKHLLETQTQLFNETKIVIFTFNKTLAAYIKAIKPYINGGYQKDSEEINARTEDGLNVQVANFHSWAYQFLGLSYNQTITGSDQINAVWSAIQEVKSNVSPTNILGKSTEFFKEEISWMKGKLLDTKAKYIDAPRTGRGTSDRVTRKDKEAIWDVYEKYSDLLQKKGKVDFDDYAILVLRKIETDEHFEPPYTHIIVDEAQDLNKAQILSISELVSSETNSLSIIADAAQRIYKSGFVWSEVGINVRGGRTIEFKNNYRNATPIAKAALSLLNNEVDKTDFTDVKSARKGTEKPKIGYFPNFDSQMAAILRELVLLRKDKQLSSTVILNRSWKGVHRVNNYLVTHDFATELVKSKDAVDYASNKIKICTMSSIKGLEFNNVFIVDLNDDVLPFPSGFIDNDDDFHVSTERRLLYTCMTRARDKLYLFCSDRGQPSRYLKEIDPMLFDNICPINQE